MAQGCFAFKHWRISRAAGLGAVQLSVDREGSGKEPLGLSGNAAARRPVHARHKSLRSGFATDWRLSGEELFLAGQPHHCLLQLLERPDLDLANALAAEAEVFGDHRKTAKFPLDGGEQFAAR